MSTKKRKREEINESVIDERKEKEDGNLNENMLKAITRKLKRKIEENKRRKRQEHRVGNYW